MKVIEITSENFNEEVMKSDKPVLLDFWAGWCMPCRMLSPVVDEIAEEFDSIKVGKVNIEEQEELTAKFGINSIPTLAYIKEGQLADVSVGVKSKESILEMLGL